MDADGHTTTYAHLNQRLHTRHAFKIYKICATHYHKTVYGWIQTYDVGGNVGIVEIFY
jgi:hypothetical protein